mmetsp:Transcript_79962/g.171293  ORF Transcript_79962/g.171293 Transcript_79962/m.171293 type:complete len:150 (+) Transcript_79962:111-560(+)
MARMVSSTDIIKSLRGLPGMTSGSYMCFGSSSAPFAALDSQYRIMEKKMGEDALPPTEAPTQPKALEAPLRPKAAKAAPIRPAAVGPKDHPLAGWARLHESEAVETQAVQPPPKPEQAKVACGGCKDRGTGSKTMVVPGRKCWLCGYRN